MTFFPRATGLTLKSVEIKIDCCASLSIDLLNSSDSFSPSREGIMCPKANINTHLCSEGRKHQKAEKSPLFLSFPAPIRSGRFSLFVENVVSTLKISGNKEKVSISSKVIQHAANTIAC
jgi:hypothetical protein